MPYDIILKQVINCRSVDRTEEIYEDVEDIGRTFELRTGNMSNFRSESEEDVNREKEIQMINLGA